MKEVIMDTSFILSATKHKLDYAHHFHSEGYTISVPRQVKRELELIATPSGGRSGVDQEAALLALRIIASFAHDEPNLTSATKKSVDDLLANYANNADYEVVLATLDKELQGKVKGKKAIIRQGKKIEVR